MADVKIIYCPTCRRRVASWDGKSVANPIGKCKKCNKIVIFDVEKQEIKTNKVPQRNTASGMTFY